MIIDIRGQDLSNKDLSTSDLVNAIIAHCDLTNVTLPPNCQGCNFAGSYGMLSFNSVNITGTNFENCDIERFDFNGAIWHDTILTKSQLITTNTPTWCMETDVFIQIGCYQDTYKQFEIITDSVESLAHYIKQLSIREAEYFYKWWHYNKSLFTFH